MKHGTVYYLTRGLARFVLGALLLSLVILFTAWALGHALAGLGVCAVVTAAVLVGNSAGWGRKK